MRAAKRKWARRRAEYLRRERANGINAANDWLKRFNTEKVIREIFGPMN